MLSQIIITVCLLHRLSAHPPPPPNIISPWRHAPDADNVRRNPRAYAPRPESVMNKSWDGRVHTDCVDSSMVALTFDDGVNEGTERVLDFLRQHDIKATFFILGSQVNQRTLKRLVKEGHLVGSHSWDHPSFPQLGEHDMRWQLQSTEDAIYRACRRRPRLFRPPYGDVDWRVSSVVVGEGYEIVNWNVDSNDWHGDPWAAQSAITGGLGGGWKRGLVLGEERRRRPQRRGGFIVLQHDAYFQDFVGEATVKAARRNGLRFVTLAECLGVDAYKNQREVDRENQPALPVVTTTSRVTTSRTTTTTKPSQTTSTRKTTTRHHNHHNNSTTETKAFEDVSIFTIPSIVSVTTPTSTTSTSKTTSSSSKNEVVSIPTPVPLATLVIAVPIISSTPPAAQPTYDPVPVMRLTAVRRHP